jgi:hypothetical protein
VEKQWPIRILNTSQTSAFVIVLHHWVQIFNKPRRLPPPPPPTLLVCCTRLWLCYQDPDPAQEPTGQSLVENEAAEDPPLGLRDVAWMRQLLWQATKVLCLAEEVCDTATKKEWQPCAYNIYRWQMEQEVGHLCACFGGPDEDEARVKAQRQARAWLARAH